MAYTLSTDRGNIPAEISTPEEIVRPVPNGAGWYAEVQGAVAADLLARRYGFRPCAPRGAASGPSIGEGATDGDEPAPAPEPKAKGRAARGSGKSGRR